MHTLRQLAGLALAFTLGAGLCEIKNLRQDQALILHYEREIADVRVDTELNYFNGYIAGTERLHSGNSTSQTAPSCPGPACVFKKLGLAR